LNASGVEPPHLPITVKHSAPELKLIFGHVRLERTRLAVLSRQGIPGAQIALQSINDLGDFAVGYLNPQPNTRTTPKMEISAIGHLPSLLECEAQRSQDLCCILRLQVKEMGLISRRYEQAPRTSQT
jgi:hypothetical protein